MESLSVRYRPRTFEEVCGQKSVVKILNKQIETKTFSNVYLFAGASGCGKTTLARIVANKINNGLGQPIEIDAASIGSTEEGGIKGAIKTLIENAQERSIDSEYKVYIVDECHALSNQAWQAMLKTIEEPPKFTLFFFCTTEYNKVPETIKNRCQTFKISKVADQEITYRLSHICNQEHFTFTVDALDYLCRLADGSMRQAISYLDKCKDYDTNITLDNVKACLGDYSYDVYFDLTNSLIDNNKSHIFDLIDNLSDQGNDLKTFINSYLTFVLQLNKYCLLRNIDVCKIPRQLEDKVKYATGIENNTEYFGKLLDKVLNIKIAIKNDSDIKTTIQAMLVSNGTI